MIKNFHALQAMAVAQMDVLKGDKAKIVKTVAAGMLAAAMAVPGVANAQEEAKSNFGETAVGAAIGGVAGWGVAKIFGAGAATRNVLGGVGAVLGGVIANNNAEAKEAPQVQPAARTGLIPLGGVRTDRMTQLQRDALNARLDYQIAFRQAQMAKADRALDPASKIAEQGYKDAATTLVRAHRYDADSVGGFIFAYEVARDAGFDLSAYAATYSKLKQPFNVNDQSYAKLAQQVSQQATLGSEVAAEAKAVAGTSATDPSRGGFAP